MKIWGILCYLMTLGLLSACSDQSVKEYFCESYAATGSLHYYKQQVVSTSKEQLCVLWPGDALHCANANASNLSAWHEAEGKQVREVTTMKGNKDGGVLSIEQVFEKNTNQESKSEKPVPVLRFEFQQKASTLTVSSSDQEELPVVYTCKPWTKQAWWQLY